MAITVTERWSGVSLSKKPPWVASRTYDVTGTSDPIAATNAVPYVPGQQWIAESPLLCTGPSLVDPPPGPLHFVVRVDFMAPAGAADFGDAYKPTLEWQTVETSEGVDVDLDGSPIQNTAQDRFDPPARPIAYKRMVFRRMEPFYDINKSEIYENSVNSDNISITFGGSTVPILKEHCWCKSISPEQPYNGYEPKIIIAYQFEVVLDNSLGDHPFQHRFLDQGNNGWYNDGANRPGQFSDGNGNLLDRKILLDGTGKPRSAEGNIKIGTANKTPISPPAIPFYDYNNSSTYGGIIYFKRVRLAPFAPML